MGNENTRVRIKKGDNELEIEGTREVVDFYLEKFLTIIGEGSARGKGTSSIQKKGGSKETRSKKSETAPDIPRIIQNLVNHIRAIDEYPIINNTIIRPSKKEEAVLLVYYYQYEIDKQIYLTSGSVYKVLEELGVKISSSEVSRYCAGKRGDIGQYLKYEKTGKKAKSYRILERGRGKFEEVMEGIKDA